MKYRPLLITICMFVWLPNAAIIKDGSVLDIQVIEHPEFSGRFSVGDNGTIEYPLLADVPISNVTTSELMNDLTFRLARHVDNPLVLVTIVEKPPITIQVLGQVVSPGRISTLPGVSLQEVIKSADGTLETADLSRIKIIYHDRPRATEIYNLELFLQNGEMNDMPYLEEDDIVIVLSRERTKKVKVIGAVRKPGLFSLDEKVNIFEIIYLAGGPDEKADLSKIRIFSRLESEKTVEELVDIQSFIDRGEMDEIPMVNEGDVIIVYSKWFDWKTLLTILNNALLFVVTIQAFSGIFGK